MSGKTLVHPLSLNVATLLDIFLVALCVSSPPMIVNSASIICSMPLRWPEGGSLSPDQNECHI